MTKKGWTFEEIVGTTVVNSTLLLPMEERRAVFEEERKRWEEYERVGTPCALVHQDDGLHADKRICCPYGCAEGGPARHWHTESTLVEWVGGPEENPNHFTMEAECLTCNRRFLKHWVPRHKKGWYGEHWSAERPKDLLSERTCCKSLGR